MTKKEQRDREKHLITLELGSENIKTMLKALDVLGQAEIGYEQYGRRAINGLCYAIEGAVSDMDDADRKLRDCD